MKNIMPQKNLIQWLWNLKKNPPGTPNNAPSARTDKQLCDAFANNEGTWSHLQENEVPPSFSRSRIQALIEEGAFKKNGITLKSKAAILPGDCIELTIPALRPLALVAEDKPLDLLFEDEHLAVINKPAPLTVHPSETQTEGTLVHILLHHLKNLSGIGGVMRPGIVHRLDKDTSGVLVVSKTDEAHVKLSEMFARHDPNEMERRYWALCYNTPDFKKISEQRPSLPALAKAETRTYSKGRLTLKTLIDRNPAKDSESRKKMAVVAEEGRIAITHLTLIESLCDERISLIEAHLETGRTHQIRVHLTHLGFPLLNDPLYGITRSTRTKFEALPSSVKEAVGTLPGQALHARLLAFIHPITGEKMRFEAQPPPAFSAVLSAAGSKK